MYAYLGLVALLSAVTVFIQTILPNPSCLPCHQSTYTVTKMMTKCTKVIYIKGGVTPSHSAIGIPVNYGPASGIPIHVGLESRILIDKTV